MALVTVARFVDPPSAHLARGLLEANGIESFVFNEHYVGMDWLHSQAVGGVELRVDRERAAQARALLDDPPSISPGAGVEDEPESQRDASARCPRCDVGAARPDRLDHRLRALSLWIGVPLAFGRDRMRCEACGHRWRDRPAHRGALYRLVDGVVFLWSVWVAIGRRVLALPARLVRALTGRRLGVALECWACGTPFRAGAPRCLECGVMHPPLAAFRRVIEPGRPYDATCSACHTPWVRADYAGDPTTWTCSVCRGPLA